MSWRNDDLLTDLTCRLNDKSDSTVTYAETLSFIRCWDCTVPVYQFRSILSSDLRPGVPSRKNSALLGSISTDMISSCTVTCPTCRRRYAMSVELSIVSEGMS